MVHGLALPFALLLTSCVSGAAPQAPSAPLSTARTGVWITYWDFARGAARVAVSEDTIHDVFFFAAQLNADGLPELALSDEKIRATTQALKRPGRRFWLTLVNDTVTAETGTPPGAKKILKDPEIVRLLTQTPALRARLRERLATLAILCGVDGVDIDFENFKPECRDGFCALIEELKRDLKLRGLLLSVTVEPRIADWSRDRPGPIDLAALSRAADRVQIMLYHEHWRKSAPGPMASPAWIRRVLDAAFRHGEKQKIVPVLKLAGMDWSPKDAESVSHQDALQLAKDRGAKIERDAKDSVPYFRYRDEGSGEHAVYFEDAESINAKRQALEAMGLSSVVFWSLGGEDPDLLRPAKR